MSMSTQQHLPSVNYADRDLYARERVLNSAIIGADISRGWEEYLEIVDAFYADHVEVTDGTESGEVFGRERIRTLLFKFLVPLHVMAEIGGLSIQIQESPIHGDTADETHSAWSLDLVGVSGRACKLACCTLSRWADSRVGYERHSDHPQTGRPPTGAEPHLCSSPPRLGRAR